MNLAGGTVLASYTYTKVALGSCVLFSWVKIFDVVEISISAFGFVVNFVALTTFIKHADKFGFPIM